MSTAQLMSADWLWTVAALSGDGVLQRLRLASAHLGPAIGADRSGDLVPSLPQPRPRKHSIMLDYRADGYGFCWNQAPRLSIIKPGWKLLLNADSSRLELFNHSVAFEADSVADTNQDIVQHMRAEVLAWMATLDPVKPGTMGAKARHEGCDAYRSPQTRADQIWTSVGNVSDPVALYRL